MKVMPPRRNPRQMIYKTNIMDKIVACFAVIAMLSTCNASPLLKVTSSKNTLHYPAKTEYGPKYTPHATTVILQHSKPHAQYRHAVEGDNYKLMSPSHDASAHDSHDILPLILQIIYHKNSQTGHYRSSKNAKYLINSYGHFGKVSISSRKGSPIHGGHVIESGTLKIKRVKNTSLGKK